ncbi:hypothetical protein QMO56_00255 [Roseomonas sp. E05]|uniref:hypothetical protein n=1 Tax=Roseomonas sp. E05 TaxID=3046310 RepID=UPI0024BBAC27|nr:hypothetical protein [Roseomonas sp. E05]MDJ0386527.1 hypothetical protein [Roseomonas sp. E05]
MRRRAWLAAGLAVGWAVGLAGCAAPQEAPAEPAPARPSGQTERDRAAELACIRRGRAAEVSQPWLGATNPRAAVIGARVRNDCLDAYRRSGILPAP